jgi:hypothetical protein
VVSALIAQWLYYATVSFKFFLEDYDTASHWHVHFSFVFKLVILIVLVIFGRKIGFEVTRVEHFILPAMNYFCSVWFMHLLKLKVFG